MDWLKQHADTIAVLALFIVCFWHLDGKLDTLSKEVRADIAQIKTEIAVIKTEIAVVKAVMIMQKLMPSELAIHGEKINEN